MSRVAIRLGVNVAGALPFEESGAFRRWISISRLVGSDLGTYRQFWKDYGLFGSYSGPEVRFEEVCGGIALAGIDRE